MNSRGETISVVMPIHNEERMLPISLPSIVDKRVDEYLFVLDRCSDRSEEIIRAWATRFNLNHKTRILLYSSGKRVWRVDETFNHGFSQAKSELIYKMDADILFDTRAFDVELRKNEGGVSFKLRYIPEPIHDQFYNIIMKILGKRKALISCLYFTKKKIFENVGGFRDLPQGDCEDYIKRVTETGYKWRREDNIVFTHYTYHLEQDSHVLAMRKKAWQIRCGQILRIRNKSFLFVFMYSIFRIRRYTMLGYIAPRRYHTDLLEKL
jgi:glycosyltransferase involved in cell wall biosynthesis